MAARTDDPIRDLNNYLQNVKGQNLTQLLQNKSQQTGPNNQAVHTWAYIFRNVTIGRGEGTTRAAAKRGAATEALDYFDTNGIPE